MLLELVGTIAVEILAGLAAALGLAVEQDSHAGLIAERGSVSPRAKKK